MHSIKEVSQNPSAPIRLKSPEKLNLGEKGFFIYQCDKRGLSPQISIRILEAHPDLETYADLLKLVEGDP